MRRKLLCCLLSCLLVLTMMPMTVFGGQVKTSKDGKWKIDADYARNTCTVKEYLGAASSELVIPATIDGLKVTKIQAYGGKYFDKSGVVQTLTLPKYLKEIGDMAFMEMDSLKTVKFPASLTKVGTRVFFDCDKIEEVTLPSKLKVVGPQMFLNCDGLKKVTLSKYTTEIGGHAFEYCSGLKEITLPSTLKKIGERSFAHSALEKIKIPNSAVLEAQVFYGCKALKEVNLPTAGKQVYGWTFSGCEALEDIIIPSGYYFLGSGAFENCKSMTNIVFRKDATLAQFATTIPANENLTVFYPSGAKNIAAYCDKFGVRHKTLNPPAWADKSRTNTTATLKWKKVNGAAEYKVYRKTGSGSYKLIKTTTGTYFKNYNLKKGTTYKYYVKTVKKDTAGKKVYSLGGSVYTAKAR